MATVRSKDGTNIAFEKSGQGAPVILVDGALCSRGFGPMPSLSALLANHFTVFIYDRRGRGESGDNLPYAVEREIEDIAALINEAGGSAYVYGTSSGAALALEAAISGLPIKKLALYEPPYDSSEYGLRSQAQYTADLAEVLSKGGSGGAAVEVFMARVGTPPEAIAGMKQSPMWPLFEAVGHTLAYDNAVLGSGAVPTARAATITIPTLIMTGSATFPFMHETAQALEKAIPNAQRRILEGQTHDAAADVVAPALIEFFEA